MLKLLIIFAGLILLLIYLNDSDKNIIEYIKNSNNLFNSSGKINIISLENKDVLSITNFLKNKLSYEQILIPKNVSYHSQSEYNENDKFIFNKLSIIGINNNIEENNTIDLEFISMNNDTFISDQYLFGVNGNFVLKKILIKNKLTNNHHNHNNNNNNNNLESVINDIPDIIYLTTDSIEADTPINTTESIMNKIKNI